VVALSDMFADPPIRSVDADGSPVLPRLQSRVLTGGPFLKAFGDGHLTYDVRTAAAAPSALSLSLSKEIEQGGFAFSSNFASIAGPDPARQRFPISGDGHGLSFSLAATVESTKCELYAVEAEHRSYEEQADM
jgi:hypothetical protein